MFLDAFAASLGLSLGFRSVLFGRKKAGCLVAFA